MNKDLADTLDRLEKSGDRVVVSFEIAGQGRSVEGTMTAAEARAAVSTATNLGATRVSIRRHEV